MKRLRACVAAAALLFAASSANAEDVTFNGFGQIVAGSTLGNNHPFPNENYSGDPSFDQESLFALQARADLVNNLSATAQIVAASANQNNYQPTFEWAYASYQLSDNWTIKGGRQRIPFYLYSDDLQVGEAYPWIRPPIASYIIPVDDYDGLSASGQYSAGRWDLRPRLIYGSGDSTAYYRNQALDVHLNNAVGGAFEASFEEWLTLRASYFVGTGTVHTDSSDQLIAALDELGDTGSAAAISTINHQARFAGTGFEVNRDRVLFSGEYTQILVDNSFLPKNHGYYLVAGYHFGRLMPLLTYGHSEDKFPNTNFINTVAPVAPAPPAAPGTPGYPAFIEYETYLQVLGGVKTLAAEGHLIDDYYEVGARYDLSNTTAVKLDFTRYGSGVPGTPYANLLSAAFTFNF